jgi:DNA-directed RNA polymerase II subunit RPB2
MPFTKDGITPDIIINPNAFPKRMTIGQFIESLLSKVSAIRGHETDGTPFSKLSVNEIRGMMKDLGYEENGYEYLYNGMTGKKMKAMIFIGPTYYQRLKHMVADKSHSRARGPRQQLTRRDGVCLSDFKIFASVRTCMRYFQTAGTTKYFASTKS